MTHRPRASLPAGYALKEYQDADGKWWFEAFQRDQPERHSPPKARRFDAVQWAWVQRGKAADDAAKVGE